jgi:hypothetical protein
MYIFKTFRFGLGEKYGNGVQERRACRIGSSEVICLSSNKTHIGAYQNGFSINEDITPKPAPNGL